MFRGWDQHPHGCCVDGLLSRGQCGPVDFWALGAQCAAALGMPACPPPGQLLPTTAPAPQRLRGQLSCAVAACPWNLAAAAGPFPRTGVGGTGARGRVRVDTAVLYEMELAEAGADLPIRSPTRHIFTESVLCAHVCPRFWGRCKKVKKITAVTEPRSGKGER